MIFHYLVQAPEPEAEKADSAAGDDKDASEASDVIAPLAKKFERVAYVDGSYHLIFFCL